MTEKDIGEVSILVMTNSENHFPLTSFICIISRKAACPL